MKNRNEIRDEYKWNLSHIYENYEKWEEDFNIIKTLSEELENYRGSFNKREKFLEFLKKEEEINKISYKVYRYPQFFRDLDSMDEIANGNLQRIQILFSEISIKMSWVEEEIIKNGDKINEWIEEIEFSSYKFHIKNLFRLREHILDDEKSKLLSYYSNFFSNIKSIYSELTISDVVWPEIVLENGEKIKITPSVYYEEISTNRNQRDRKKLFENYYKIYKDKENTIAAIYNGILQKNIGNTRAYNYKTFLSKNLEVNNIPEEVYLNLINFTKNNTDVLKRYIKLRKKILNLEKYNIYDNSIGLVDYNEKYDYETAKEMILKSIKLLGVEYEDKMKKALEDGWIDVYETKNKRSGAYSAGVYGVHPYMLLNYNGTLDSVFTLSHELGHTLHTLYSQEKQPFSMSEYTIFVAEVASTFNERLLLDYMIKNSKNSMEKIKLIEQSIGNIVGTYYTQVMFADFEYRSHKLVEEGHPITSNVLNNIMKELYMEYYGETIESEELMYILWTRIPHFYNSPFYVYQYATSFVASMELYKQTIINENKENLDKYLELLGSGGNDFPVNQLKKTGIDLEKVDFSKIISTELEKLLNMLEREISLL